jgi:hypothetical protein
MGHEPVSASSQPTLPKCSAYDEYRPPHSMMKKKAAKEIALGIKVIFFVCE